jgi:predicted nucleic acid-binding Zn ribbon protein
MSNEILNPTVDEPAVACPRCKAPLLFRRSAPAPIDACGLESYRFACNECGTAVGGVIDPADDELLISEIAG